MKRKIIQIAGSTCLVSLPKTWIKRQNIKKGEEVEVSEQGNKIIVDVEQSQSLPKIVIDRARFGKFHRNYLSAAYHMGFDDVEIHFEDPKAADIIQDRVNTCMGFEIVNQGHNICQIKSVSMVSLKEFSQMLRKVFLLLVTMSENTISLLEKGNFAGLSDVRVLEMTNNKLTDFCKRVLNKKGYDNFNQLTTIYTVCMYLERVADEYRDLCDALMKRKEKISPSVMKDLKDVHGLFVAFYNYFYKGDKENLEKIFFTAPDLRLRMLERMMKAPPCDRIVLHVMVNLLSEIYELANASVEMHMVSELST